MLTFEELRNTNTKRRTVETVGRKKCVLEMSKRIYAERGTGSKTVR